MTKKFNDAADKKIWPLFGHMKEPGEHGRGGGFAVRATDDDGMFAWKKFFFNYFGERTVRQPAVEHLLDFNIAARNRVAHDDKIRRGG